MKERNLKFCLHCGNVLKGKQTLFCSPDHKKEFYSLRNLFAKNLKEMCVNMETKRRWKFEVPVFGETRKVEVVFTFTPSKKGEAGSDKYSAKTAASPFNYFLFKEEENGRW